MNAAVDAVGGISLDFGIHVFMRFSWVSELLRAGNPDKLRQFGLFHKADLFEIAGVNPHKSGGIRADRSGEVVRMGAVGSAHLH